MILKVAINVLFTGSILPRKLYSYSVHGPFALSVISFHVMGALRDLVYAYGVFVNSRHIKREKV